MTVDSGSPFRLHVPVERRTLDNGLRVVLAPDRTAPVVTVAVYYNVGIRLEPKGRSGFAHLFEHLMFQGSGNMKKMELVAEVQRNGGRLNGSTRYDFTNYFEVLPSHALDLALWMEADRMRGPAITQTELDNQRDVVKNEIKVNVLNRPYGGFPWIAMNEHAYENWHNSHNGYGDFVDLDAANLDDVKEFFDTFYAPNNAALVVVGDLDVDATFASIERFYGDIPAGDPPPKFDVSEPRQEEERRASMADRLANRPALAVSWKIPDRSTPQFHAMGLLDEALVSGDDSLLHRELVARRGLTGGVGGGMNFLGHQHNALTPLLWTVSLIHDQEKSTDEVLAALDTVIDRVVDEGLSDEVIDRARVKARSGYLDLLNDAAYPGFGRADLLASFTLFDDDPGRIETVLQSWDDVTPDLVRETAAETLRRGNRTVLSLDAGAAS